MATTITFDSSWLTHFDRGLVLKPAILDPNIYEQYNVDNTVYKSKTLTQFGNFGNIVRNVTSCGFASSGALTISEKEISTCQKGFDIELCWVDFQSNQLNLLLKRGTAKPDLTGTEIEQAVIDQLKPAVVTNTIKLAWFMDLALTGNTFYGGCKDGFFIKLTNTATDINITETGDLGANAALAYLRTMHTTADRRLKALGNKEKRFYVTSSVYNNLLESYEVLDLESGMSRTQNGTVQNDLYFRGIQVIEVAAWDEAIAELGLSDPNRIVYTTPMNLVIGTDVLLPGQDMRIWFEQKDEKVYILGRWEFGVQTLFAEWSLYAH